MKRDSGQSSIWSGISAHFLQLLTNCLKSNSMTLVLNLWMRSDELFVMFVQNSAKQMMWNGQIVQSERKQFFVCFFFPSNKIILSLFQPEDFNLESLHCFQSSSTITWFHIIKKKKSFREHCSTLFDQSCGLFDWFIFIWFDGKMIRIYRMALSYG